MNSKLDCDYYLGLDIGTSSLGWAVTDTNYNILDYRRKAMWGIHLFDEGKTAEERRMHRCARRRLNRRKQRITLLRELFSEEICKVDPAFFDRLDSSSLFVEDRDIKQKNSLFNDADFDDADYHRRFPTIYHLRRYLMEAEEKPDIRLVYLACHHIVKYRGHFLFGEMKASNVPPFSEVFDCLYSDMQQYDSSLYISNIGELSELLSKRMSVNDKKNSINELGCGESDFWKEMSALLAGSKVSLEKLFDNEELKDFKICFKDSSVEDNMIALEDSIDADYFHTLRLAKQVYDWAVLSNLLSGSDSISVAKIKLYDQHQKDLSILKKAIREYIPSKYKDVFKSGKIKGNYCSYVGRCGKGKPEKTCDQEEFCKYIRTLLDKTNIKDDEKYLEFCQRINDASFMPKQTSKNNSVFPYSVHKYELESILNNVSKFYPFLTTVDDDGFSVKEKILMIQCFRIPYYVGPLGKTEKAWAVRRSSERITPWNFKKVIDLDASAEGFMNNLTSFCTYLVGEKVLPKNSIVYSYYQLYNELNNIRVNGEKISVELKKQIVDELFKKCSSKVTKKKILEYLISIGVVDKKEKNEITGIDDIVKSSLKSEHVLKKVIGDKICDRKMCEGIIRIITVFGDEQRISSKLKVEYPDKLTHEEIVKLSKIKFEGWGRLSEKLLTGLYDVCRETGQQTNIMGMLESTNDNFMEIYHKYSFKNQVEKHNHSMTVDNEVTYKTLESMYISPAVRRSVWRTISVVKDILDSIGHVPKKVFVETTREVSNARKGDRTVSRKDALLQLYKDCKEDQQWIENLESREEADLKSRSVYLYYTQLGRCMYCGRHIDLEELNNTDSVDRDHIFPQSKVKDDSIVNNMVLACKECNGKKSNIYPISYEVQKKMKPFWDILRSRKYISDQKYSRLVRSELFSDDELDKFINRQLVETSQSVNAVIDVLHRLFGDETEVVYVKGGLVSEFRQEYDFVKCRSVNDYHHAKDAYLNIVVGNAYDTKFTKNSMNFVKSGESYNLAKMYNKEISRNGIVAWVPGDSGTIQIVRKYMRRDNILFTKYQYVVKGKLFDDNLIRAKESLFNRKTGMPASKYGGFDNQTGSCYSLIEYEIKGKTIRSLEVLHLHSIKKLSDVVQLNKYYSDRIGSDVKVIIPVVRMNSLFDWNGFRLHIGGRTNNSIVYYPAVQLLLSDQSYAYCKKLFKFDEDRKNKITRNAEYYGISRDSNIELYNVLLEKIRTDLYQKMMKSLHDNMISISKRFESSDELLQAEILNEVLSSLHCNPETTSFKKIGGVNLTGRIIKNKKLPSDEVVYLISQSVSGLKESRLKVSL